MLKELEEKRAELQTEMEQILAKAKEEKRAINEEESARFDEIEKEIGAIDKTMAAEKRATELAADKKVEEEVMQTEQRAEQNEVRAFEAYLRGNEVRADFTKTANGAVIPESIAKKIIDKVMEISPLYHDAERYNVKGALDIPYYDTTTQDITVGFVTTEGSAATATAGEFKSIQLKGFLASAVSDISKTLINNSDFDIVGFVVNKMAENIAKFIEKELVTPSDAVNKVAGLSGATAVATATQGVIVSDDLINLQESIPDAYQANAYFIMSRATRKAIRKLKDGQNNYLLNKDFNARWGYTLLGKDVYVSENMPTFDSNTTTGDLGIYYGDMTGLAVKVSEEVNIEVLREVKAANHMVEVVGFVEFDAKVQNAQKVAKLVSA